jgi:hypothetical protein
MICKSLRHTHVRICNWIECTVTVTPNVPWNFDPELGPGPGWIRSGPRTNWYNPETGESLRWDQNHRPPIEPHNDYWPGSGGGYRWYENGTMEPKTIVFGT